MTESNYAYFHRRAAEERAAAMRAAHPLARQAHFELAQRYETAAAASSGQVIQLRRMQRA
jgi:hypothetical protein